VPGHSRATTIRVLTTPSTVDPTGQPRTRVLHPIWESSGDQLTGWIATGPDTPKARHLNHESRISMTYWDSSQDTCTADCDTTWLDDPADRVATWETHRLSRVFPGTLLLQGQGDLLTWSNDSA